MQRFFSGEQILVVEDDCLIAADIVEKLRAAGAEIVGPFSGLEEAMETVRTTPDLHSAVLDVNLQGKDVFLLADMLLDRKVPYVFATSYDASMLPPRHAGAGLVPKPFDLGQLVLALYKAGHVPARRSDTSANRLLRALDDGFNTIAPLLTPIHLRQGDILLRAGEPFAQALFIETGVISLIAAAGHREIEVGLIGPEGMTGSELLASDPCSPYKMVVQTAGQARAIDHDDLVSVCAILAPLRMMVSRFGRTLGIQTAFTALVNGRFKLEQKLARWLLMMEDRVASRHITLTHDFLAVMLGVHRPAVTLALQMLEGRGLIKSMRGQVQIRDRQGLVEFAGGAYGQPEEEYRRIMGFDLRQASEDVARATL